MGQFCFPNVLLLAFKVAKEFARALCKSCVPSMIVGKASALACGSLNPKMCETTLSVREKMQAPIWRCLWWRWSAISRDHFPSCCPWITRERSSPPLRAGRVMKDVDKWKVLLQWLAGNLSFEDCEPSLLTKCPSSLGKLSKTGGYQGMLLLEIIRWTCACSESWNMTVKNN